jgi:tetratricopeptide (TPR) repeat protein
MSATLRRLPLRAALTAVLLFSSFATEAAGDKPASTSAQSDKLPMYGQPAVARSKKMQEADEEYIRQATEATNGDRKAAAANMLDEAERQMSANKPDEAMKSYNHAWLLNPDDFQAYWGFGRIQLMDDNVDDAIRHFDKAVGLVNDPDMKPLVLTDAGIAYSLKASRAAPNVKTEKAALFAKANDLFQQSITLNPDYGIAWLRWSQSLLREAKYADAWAKAKKAQDAGTQVPKGYLRTLSEKMPEPKE